MTDEEFIQKLKKEAFFEHSGVQKEVLWGRLKAYVNTDSRVGFWHFGFRLTYLFGVVLVVLLTSAGVTFAAQESLPGQTLYPVKRWSEEAVIFVKFDETAKKKARVELTTKRVDEVNKLVAEDPEKAGEVLDEYERDIEGFIVVFMDDPDLSQTLEITISANREYLMRAAEAAPDEMRIKIEALIEEEPDEPSVGDDESQEPQDGSTMGEVTDGPASGEDPNDTSSPQP